jgi:hypothetical protein
MDKMCNSCHSENGSASNKIPEISFHPDILFVSRKNNDIEKGHKYFPLFDRLKGKTVVAENISCPSCHNVHQWDSKAHAQEKEINIEGNATNSFLRTESSLILCKDCHGADSLFRFKFYHDSEKRMQMEF